MTYKDGHGMASSEPNESGRCAPTSIPATEDMGDRRHEQLLDYPVALKSPGVIEMPFSLISLPLLGFGVMRVMFGIPNRLQF
jgi:hypothetical protein